MNKESQHPLGLGNCSAEYLGQDSRVYTDDELDIKLTHVPPVTFIDKVAHFGVRVIRLCFDTVSLWNFGEITQKKVFRRVIFLETVAAIPGFVAAMVRHFKSLRTFSRDGGMMQMFLDEANNERMHLLTFVRMKNPSYLARALVLVSQTVVGAGFFIVYNISPDLCHRFVGYVGQYCICFILSLFLSNVSLIILLPQHHIVLQRKKHATHTRISLNVLKKHRKIMKWRTGEQKGPQPLLEDIGDLEKKALYLI